MQKKVFYRKAKLAYVMEKRQWTMFLYLISWYKEQWKEGENWMQLLF